jgi:transposase
MEHFVGIDVAKDRLDVHIRPGGEVFAVGRDGKGLAVLVKRLQALAPVLVAMEATGGYETVVASAVGAAQLPLAVVNPRQIRDFAHATGKLAKTDRIDAAAIAHFAETVRPPARPIADAQAQALGELVARRRQVIEMIVAEGHRRRMASQRRVITAIERHLACCRPNSPNSKATSTARSAKPRLGRKRPICWPACLVSAKRRCEP